LLAGFEERREAFKELGVSFIAATVDSQEETAKVAEPLGFPVAYGVTREQGDAIGAWWDERRDHIQPSEFLLTKSGKVMMSTYSNSPIGRMDPAETLTLISYLNAQRAKGKAPGES
jgi:alkyl hydroperoxide reductase subunit AhpC